MVGPAARRECVAHLQAELGLSELRACGIVNAIARWSGIALADRRTQLRELANERKRFGYRRLFVLLRQQGEPSGLNRIYRLYREDGLTVRKRRARRRAWAPGLRSWSRPGRMLAGRWISSMTSSPAIAVFGY